MEHKTISELYDPAMEITDQKEADKHFKYLIERLMELGKDRKWSEYTVKENLAYYAGYFDNDTRLRVEKLFKCEHPVFDRATDTPVTINDAYHKGRDAESPFRDDMTKGEIKSNVVEK